MEQIPQVFMESLNRRAKKALGQERSTTRLTVRVERNRAMMFLLFTLSGVANALIDERRNAVFMRMLLILAMSAVGGAWFPTSIMPPYIQALSKFSLVYRSISGFLAVLWAGATFIEILPILGVLGGIAALVIGVSLWKFSRTNVL